MSNSSTTVSPQALNSTPCSILGPGPATYNINEEYLAHIIEKRPRGFLPIKFTSNILRDKDRTYTIPKVTSENIASFMFKDVKNLAKINQIFQELNFKSNKDNNVSYLTKPESFWHRMEEITQIQKVAIMKSLGGKLLKPKLVDYEYEKTINASRSKLTQTTWHIPDLHEYLQHLITNRVPGIRKPNTITIPYFFRGWPYKKSYLLLPFINSYNYLQFIYKDLNNRDRIETALKFYGFSYIEDKKWWAKNNH